MIPRLRSRRLLGPEDIPPSQDDLRVVGAFNPGVIDTGDGITLLVRVAETAREKRPAFVALPRWDPAGARIGIDWLPEDEVFADDPRVVTIRSTGLKRLTFFSHLLVAHSRDGWNIDAVGPMRIWPAGELEEFGMEDPRITALNGRYYFSYVAVSRHGAATALASTGDFRDFDRLGVIFPPENKDVVLFPERVHGEFLALHRPNPAQHFTRPEIWLASSPDLTHWGAHAPLLRGADAHEAGRIGAGTPPIRTAAGWLAIYHGNAAGAGPPAGVGTYGAGAVLTDLDRPGRIIGRCTRVLAPETPYERQGFVPDVIFPTGIVPRGETVLIYYGAADQAVGVTQLRLRDLLRAVGH